MRHRKFLTISSLLLATILSASCANVKDRVIVKTEYVTPNIQVKPRPDPVNLYDVKFYAVTEQNLPSFLSQFEKENGDVAFFAISVTDYERLSLNVAELRRYIEQQKALIVYYETNINMSRIEIEPKEEIVEDGTLTTIKNKLGLK